MTMSSAARSAKRIEKFPRPQVTQEGSGIEQSGLCLTCVAASECIYRKPGSLVYDCESYDSETVPVVAPTIRVVPTHPVERRTLDGLCVNCARIGDCTLSHTDGRVWQCEEYE